MAILAMVVGVIATALAACSSTSAGKQAGDSTTAKSTAAKSTAAKSSAAHAGLEPGTVLVPSLPPPTGWVGAESQLPNSALDYGCLLNSDDGGEGTCEATGLTTETLVRAQPDPAMDTKIEFAAWTRPRSRVADDGTRLPSRLPCTADEMISYQVVDVGGRPGRITNWAKPGSADPCAVEMRELHWQDANGTYLHLTSRPVSASQAPQLDQSAFLSGDELVALAETITWTPTDVDPNLGVVRRVDYMQDGNHEQVDLGIGQSPTFGTCALRDRAAVPTDPASTQRLGFPCQRATPNGATNDFRMHSYFMGQHVISGLGPPDLTAVEVKGSLIDGVTDSGVLTLVPGRPTVWYAVVEWDDLSGEDAAGGTVTPVIDGDRRSDLAIKFYDQENNN